MFGYDFLTRSTRAWQEAVLVSGGMMLTANEVIWRRSLQFVTGTMTPAEATRMVLEKPIAFATAAHQAGRAATDGGDLGMIASAAVAPLSNRLYSNAHRLRG